MPQETLSAIAIAAHQLGTLMLVGSLYFLIFIVRPVSRRTMGVTDRQRFFLLLFSYLFRWLWVALLLLWVSGAWRAHLLGISQPPQIVLIMAGGAMLVTALTTVGHVVKYFYFAEFVETELWPQAGRTGSLVRIIMAAALLVALALVLAGVGAHYLLTASSPVS